LSLNSRQIRAARTKIYGSQQFFNIFENSTYSPDTEALDGGKYYCSIFHDHQLEPLKGRNLFQYSILIVRCQ